MTGRLRAIGVRLVVLVESSGEEDGRREVADHAVLVILVRLRVNVHLAQVVEVLGRDDGDADLLWFVVDEVLQPCSRSSVSCSSTFSEEMGRTESRTGVHLVPERAESEAATVCGSSRQRHDTRTSNGDDSQSKKRAEA